MLGPKQRTVYRTANAKPMLFGMPRYQTISVFFASAFLGQYLHSFWLWLAFLAACLIGFAALLREDPFMMQGLVRFFRSKHMYDPHLHRPFVVTVKRQ